MAAMLPNLISFTISSVSTTDERPKNIILPGHAILMPVRHLITMPFFAKMLLVESTCRLEYEHRCIIILFSYDIKYSLYLSPSSRGSNGLLSTNVLIVNRSIARPTHDRTGVFCC